MCVKWTFRVGLPAEGLLGASRLAPAGSPWRAIIAAARRCRTLIVVCRGFERNAIRDRCRNRFSTTFALVCRLRDSNPRPTVYKTVALPLC